jgi:opacity protein-like surface antigen
MILAAVTLIPGLASAENFYAAVRGGPGWTMDQETGRSGLEDTDKFKLGFTGSGAVGYAFSFGLRAEGEFGFLYIPVKTDGGVDVSGSLRDYLIMANVYYDLKIPALGPFRPYVGAGIGGARENRDHQIFVNTLGVKVDVDNWRTAFAYQGRVGIIYDVNKWLDLSAGYRYVHINGGSQTFGPAKVNFDSTNNHSAEFGFAVKF